MFETAYNTNENMLICAPTGAGKTNIAMLTVLHEIRQHFQQGVIKKNEFKVGIKLNSSFLNCKIWNHFAVVYIVWYLVVFKDIINEVIWTMLRGFLHYF